MSANSTQKRSVAARLHGHTLTRVMGLEDRRIMFLPLPKSGCTSLLWILAGLAGLDRSRFARSAVPEVSANMAVHDTSLWDDRHRWAEYTAAERERIQQDPGWLRFTVVRDPASRLWSAWQSKLLLKEPRFVQRFGGCSWFPHEARGLDDAIDAFRAFVRALDAPGDVPHDAHWGSQVGLLSDFRLTYRGRAEDPERTVRRLEQHVGAESRLDRSVPRENATPMPYHPSVFDDETAEITNRLFAPDFTELGYAPLAGEVPEVPATAWRQVAEPGVGVANQLAERHLRIGELFAELEDSHTRERRLMARFQVEAQRVRDIEASHSWRVTRPLRALRRSRVLRPGDS